MVLSGGALAATLELEAEKAWGGNDTYAYSVYATNVDGDAGNVIEILTVGKNITDIGRSYAELAIWQYDSSGDTFTLHTIHKWDQGEGGTSANSVYAADVDDDNIVEIVTAGYTTINGDTHNDLAIWSWSPIHHSFSLETELTASVNIKYNSVYAAELDSSRYLEIIVGGAHIPPEKSHLAIFQWDGTSLTTEDVWEPTSGTSAFNGVYARDVGGTGSAVEIMATGYQYEYSTMKAQLALFHLSQGSIELKATEVWIKPTYYSAESLSVYAEDVDSDSDIEIITCGNQKSGAQGYGDLELWEYDGYDVDLDGEELWTSPQGGYMRCESVHAKEVNNPQDPIEITTAGYNVSGPWAELNVWKRIPTGFNNVKTYWKEGQAFAVYVDDVDGDSTVEILVAGHTGKGAISWAHLLSYYYKP